MKTPMLASLTAKVAAGVAGVVLVTGGAGTVLALQPASERTLPATAAEAALEATGRKAAAPTTTTTSTTSTTVASSTTTDEEKKDVTTSREHPDNFGAMVSEDAQDGGVDGQEISELARARNEERRAERAEKTSAADDHRKNGDKGKPEEG